MTTTMELRLMGPQIIVALGAVVVMLSIAVKRVHGFTFVLTVLTLAASFVSLWLSGGTGPLTGLFRMDGFSRLFSGLILVAAFVITLQSYPYFERGITRKEEYYVLLLLASLGALTMVISVNLVFFFISLEVLSVSLYGLIAYLKDQPAGIEAGIKYLVLAAVSSAFLLFGIALVYFQTGHLDLAGIAVALSGSGSSSPVFVAGIALIIAGVGFKMALVPFHLWTPDIYAGAPAPVSAFVATISKGAVFAFLVRLFYTLRGWEHQSLWLVFTLMAAASMLIGNWLALRQQNFKRLLAYSSIAHLGYLLVAFLAASRMGMRAGYFYLVVYFISMLGAFGAIGFFSGKEDELLSVEDYRGLYRTRPWLTAFLTAVLLSLAGIPLTAGFMGKLYLLVSGAASGTWVVVVILVVSSTIGLFYYLRVIAVMFSSKGAAPVPAPTRAFSTGLTLVLLFILLLWFGIYPSALLEMIGHLIPGIG